MRFRFIFFFLFLSSPALQAKVISVLFIGNSFTFYPQNPENPALVEYTKHILQNQSPQDVFNFDYVTIGGHSFEKHSHTESTLNKIKSPFDFIILQGHSTDGLDLPTWFLNQDPNRGLQSAQKAIPLLISLVQPQTHILLFIPWAWASFHPLVKSNSPELFFTPPHSRAGQKWCGNTKLEHQNLIDSNYLNHLIPLFENKKMTPLFIGKNWFDLFSRSSFVESDMFNPDGFHPTALGTFFNALFISNIISQASVCHNSYIPANLDKTKAAHLQKLFFCPPL